MWWVWLPGWGCAQVHSGDIVARSDSQTKHDTRPSFPRISIVRSSRRSRQDELDLISVVAYSTPHVCVKCLNNDPLDRWLGRLLMRCPVIEILELKSVTTCELQVLVDTAVAGHATPKRLHADAIRSSNSELIASFFEALEDPAHPLTMHLEEIDLTFECRTERGMNRVLRDALSMLYENDTLCVVKLTCHVGVGAFTAFKDMSGTQFDHHTLDPLVIRTFVILNTELYGDYLYTKPNSEGEWEVADEVQRAKDSLAQAAWMKVDLSKENRAETPL